MELFKEVTSANWFPSSASKTLPNRLYTILITSSSYSQDDDVIITYSQVFRLRIEFLSRRSSDVSNIIIHMSNYSCHCVLYKFSVAFFPTQA